jgi:hypothetical protein
MNTRLKLSAHLRRQVLWLKFVLLSAALGLSSSSAMSNNVIKGHFAYEVAVPGANENRYEKYDTHQAACAAFLKLRGLTYSTSEGATENGEVHCAGSGGLRS